jgi:glutathione synthase/RimK-type ligase-like ATP-grasp enzyme
MDSLEGFSCYDHLLTEPLRSLGWEAETRSWRDEQTDWDSYEAVIIRSTWDYQTDPEAFLQSLERIEDSQARLENPLELVRWNLHKRYLRELERQGVPIVPTLFRAAGEPLELERAFADAGVEQLVIKPAVSANADHTFLLHRSEPGRLSGEWQQRFAQRDALIQPFFPAVGGEGEFSLFYFGGQFSHAIVKRAARGDFRVQEEHGGLLERCEPDAELRELADFAVDCIRPRPLYARADFVRDTGLPGASGQYYLMEMELIEPSLYFPLDPGSAMRFARVFDQWMCA